MAIVSASQTLTWNTKSRAFDYEAFALQKGLRASGTILTSEKNRLIEHDAYYHPIDSVRQILLEKIKQHLPQSKTAPWLIALIVGERSGIAEEDSASA